MLWSPRPCRTRRSTADPQGIPLCGRHNAQRWRRVAFAGGCGHRLLALTPERGLAPCIWLRGRARLPAGRLLRP